MQTLSGRSFGRIQVEEEEKVVLKEEEEEVELKEDEDVNPEILYNTVALTHLLSQ